FFRPLFGGGAFSPDGRLLAATTTDDLVFWDVTTAKESARFANPGSRYAFSPDGKTLAATTDRGATLLFYVATGRRRPRSSAPTVVVDGPWLAAVSGLLLGGVYSRLFVWSASDGREVRRFDLGWLPSPDLTRLVRGEWDGTIRLADAATGREVWSRKAHDN